MTKLLMAGVLLVVVNAAEARAQMSMGSFRGYLTGHVGAIAGESVSEERLSGGASVSVQEDNGWGAELDFGFSGDTRVGFDIIDVATYMVNASWVRPRGLIRPFGIGGAGLLQLNGCDLTCTRVARTYDLGFSAGGGAFVVLHDTAALRADARYFFTAADHPDLRRPDTFAFWRLTIGATFMWAAAP